MGWIQISLSRFHLIGVLDLKEPGVCFWDDTDLLNGFICQDRRDGNGDRFMMLLIRC